MSAAGLAGVGRRKLVSTTVKGGGRQTPDLVDRIHGDQARPPDKESPRTSECR